VCWIVTVFRLLRSSGINSHLLHCGINCGRSCELILVMAEKVQQSSQQPIVKIGHYTLGQTLGVGTFGKVKSK
jgi:hypothetical protein